MRTHNRTRAESSRQPGRSRHRVEELPNPRAPGKARKEGRPKLRVPVATKLGDRCYFKHACRFGPRCRGGHSESERRLFAQRDGLVATLEEAAGCVYCELGVCRFKEECRGQTALHGQAVKARQPRGGTWWAPPKPRPKTRRRERRRKVKGAGHRGATERASHRDAIAPHWRREEREARAANARLRDWLEGAQHKLEIQQQVARKALMREQLLREENCRQSRLLLEYDKKQVKLWGELWRLRNPTDAEPEDHMSESSRSNSGGSGGSDSGGSNEGGHYRWVEGGNGEWEDEWVHEGGGDDSDEEDEGGGDSTGSHNGSSDSGPVECDLCSCLMSESTASEPMECDHCTMQIEEGAWMMWCTGCELGVCECCAYVIRRDYQGAEEVVENEEGLEGDAEAEGDQEAGNEDQVQGNQWPADGRGNRAVRALRKGMSSSSIILWLVRLIVLPVSCVMITVNMARVGSRWVASNNPSARCAVGAIATALAFWGYTTAAVAVIVLMVALPTQQHENTTAGQRLMQAYMQESERGSYDWVRSREGMLEDLHR
jgi:hypothetical protein